jgi:hypothetical protein
MLSQTDGPQPAHASSAVTQENLARANGVASRGYSRTAAQAAPVTPAPAGTRIALTASGHTLSQDEVARLLGTSTGGTDSALDTTRALNNVVGGNVYQTREIRGPSATPAQMDQLQADVVRAISSGRAIVANIARSVTDTAGGWHAYDGGHYLTIVGYNDDGRTVKIADPANPNGAGTYWVTTINMANWIATHGYSY